VRAILDASDLELVAAVGKRAAGRSLSEIAGDTRTALKVQGGLADVFAEGPVDVLIDYTRPEAVKGHVYRAVEAGCHVVIGTSGLDDAEYGQIDRRARERGVGVFAAGNFSLTAALLQEFSLRVAHHMPHWEILDYAADTKPDAPSGTTRELAYRLGRVATPNWAVPPAATQGLKESRGATLNGSQLHSIRVPGFYSACEVIFGDAGERIELRHESTSYRPYVAGTLLAARKVQGFKGLKRGMGALLNLTSGA
jgi:4-hydroxy-tetrahydrodipicolinate reductase